MHELLHIGVPAAFFAQEKIADQQAERVARAAAVAAIALASLSADVVDAALVELFSAGAALSQAARRTARPTTARAWLRRTRCRCCRGERAVVLGAAELLTPRLALSLEGLGPIGNDLMASLRAFDPSPGLASSQLHTRCSIHCCRSSPRRRGPRSSRRC